jgi:hypothetical protein
MDAHDQTNTTSVGVLTVVRNMWPEAFLDTREQQVNYSCSSTQLDKWLQWLITNQVFMWANNPFGVSKVLKMEAACSSETLPFIYRAVSCHNPENWSANHKSHIKSRDPEHVTIWMKGSTPPLILVFTLTEVNVQIHTPDALSLGKGPEVPITLHARWAPKPVWAFWWRKNNIAQWGNEWRLRGRQAST